MAALYYERAVCGTGTAVAVGRLGSVFGPLYAGALPEGGRRQCTVLLGIVPLEIAAGLSALALSWRCQLGSDSDLERFAHNSNQYAGAVPSALV